MLPGLRSRCSAVLMGEMHRAGDGGKEAGGFSRGSSPEVRSLVTTVSLPRRLLRAEELRAIWPLDQLHTEKCAGVLPNFAMGTMFG
jgi:hypothetical protein